ncbi:MAG: Bax inhibitor-1/YccA family protein [Alphaproteobacteria bacterium]|nr:Bax inhibitor-1/YccA family protein [Alphaproteobacteria bacterium]OJV13184.1 MAG: hypothetical protein BGO27_00065 [Alphaproteobacteria bacterium 33-17]
MKFNRNQSYVQVSSANEYNEGLRKFMLGIYNYMGIGLVLTGVCAMLASSSEAFMRLMFTPQGLSGFGWLIALAPLGFAIFLSAGIQRVQVKTAQVLFYAYAAIMGLSLSSLFLVYTGESIAKTFFITAAVFGSMSIYGYTTKKDLTSMGSFLMMGVIGILIASVINIFLGSSGLSFIVSLLSVAIFTGLVAFDTQKLKQIYFAVGNDTEAAAKVSIIGALSLYMDFINIFVNLLRFFGDRRD